jgi:NADH-quinone oxidoreductase subunit L
MERIFSLDVVPWMVLFFPLAGFVVLALLGDRINRDGEQRGATLLACAAVLLSFGCALWTALHLGDAGALLEQQRQALGLEGRPAPYTPYQPSFEGAGFNFLDVAGLNVPFSLLLDQLTVVMMLVVTGIGALIHVYSLGYMAHDEERVRFFSYLNLFTFFMLVLVMGGSLPLMFIGWEGVGLCSYLLIGFWYKKKSASDAGKKAFIVNRIGDAGLILGMIVAFHAFGTVNLFDLAQRAGSLPAERWLEFGPATLLALLLFVGACGKSAQIPLHVWLPDAMEGPTPVSALIHAATMVTAGVYMVSRLGALYSVSETALAVVAVVGTLTAFLAATIALVQTDIKRVLAYSTLSQLGYMFLACGVGAFGYAVFHLYTHAFFKALLFLGSGSVIHAMSGEQDMRRMGGLRAKIPWTFGTFAVGTAAIAGIPFLAGFFSKDGILAAALEAHRPGLFAVGLATAVLTAFYMGRLLFLTFFGAFRGGHEAEHHLHESPWSMLAPLVVLAIGSIGAGYVHVPEIIRPALQLPPVEGHGAHPGWLPYVATLGALTGLGLAFYLYVAATDVPGRVYASWRGVARVLERKYGFDWAYDWFASRAVVGGSETLLWKRFDAGLIDGLVNGAGRLAAATADAARELQAGLVRGYALLMLGGALALVAWMLWGQPA